MDGITITLPSITAADITPNPVVTGKTCLLSVSVTEISKTLYPAPYYAGELYSGEL